MPNIRLKVVSMLPQLKSLLSLPADRQLLLHLETVVKELLVQETDRDVNNALQAAIHALADIETADDEHNGMTTTTTPPTAMTLSEEDRDDERKLREEKLIANMEEQIKQVQGVRFEQLIAPSAIPSRLRSLGGCLDRKRSESLPPALDRAAGSDGGDNSQSLPAAARVRYSSPEPPRCSSFRDLRGSPSSAASFAATAELGRGRSAIWSSSEVETEKNYKGRPGSNSSLPYSASLENLDPSTQEFLVDAGIKLPSMMTSAASLPNLSSIGRGGSGSGSSSAREPIVRSLSIPENSSRTPEESELSKYLISNKEMEQYEAEYHRAAAAAAGEDSTDGGLARRRGRSNTRLRPPSFTSALMEKKTRSSSPPVASSSAPPLADVEDEKKPITPPPPAPTSPSPLPLVTLGVATTVNSSSLKPPMTRNSPPPLRSEDRVGAKWNDGSIERLAEKWAAKRDTLLKETGGVLTENLYERKLAMEQKLESVKKSIPKRSFGIVSPQQKRLSLCDPVMPYGAPLKEAQPKRKSLDVDIVLTPLDQTTDSDEEDEPPSPLLSKLDALRTSSNSSGVIPKNKTTASSITARKASPELGSSDSDDSLPPYPSVEKNRVYMDQPLPPPPPAVDLPLPSPPLQKGPLASPRLSMEQPSLSPQKQSSLQSSMPLMPRPHPTNHRFPHPPPPVSRDRMPSPAAAPKDNHSLSSSGLKASAKQQLDKPAPAMTGPTLSQYSMQRPSFSSFRMVTAPHTLLAVSRSVQVPQRSIADSPCLPAHQPLPVSRPSAAGTPNVVPLQLSANAGKEDNVDFPSSSQAKPVGFLLLANSSKGPSYNFPMASPISSPRERLASSLSGSTLSSPAIRDAAAAALSSQQVGSLASSGSAVSSSSSQLAGADSKASSKTLTKPSGMATRSSVSAHTAVTASPQLQLKAQSFAMHPPAVGLSGLSKGSGTGMLSLRDHAVPTEGRSSKQPGLLEGNQVGRDVENGSGSSRRKGENLSLARMESGGNGPNTRLKQPGKKQESEQPTTSTVVAVVKEDVLASKQEVPAMSLLSRPGGFHGRSLVATGATAARTDGHNSSNNSNSLKTSFAYLAQATSTQEKPAIKATSNKTVIYIRRDQASGGNSGSSSCDSGGASTVDGELQPPAVTKRSSLLSSGSSKAMLQRPSPVVRSGKTLSMESYLDQNENDNRFQSHKGISAAAFYLHEQEKGVQQPVSSGGSNSRSPSPLDQSHRSSAATAPTAAPSLLLVHPESPALNWPDKSLLLLGSARKSSGLRMWQGGQQMVGRRGGPTVRQQQPSSAGTSRSPSPSSRREDCSSPAVRRSINVVNHATLPRASSGAASRLRGPATASTQTALPPQSANNNNNQRRSYGGGVTSLLPPSSISNGRHASAPSTPRQSSMDLRTSSSPSASRSSSPSATETRRRSAHYPLRGATEAADGSQFGEVVKSSPTRAVSERSLNAPVGHSGLRFFGGSHQSLLPSAAPEVTSASSGMASVSRIGLMRPRGSSAASSGLRPATTIAAAAGQQPQQKQSQQQQQHPTVQSSRSRVPPSHRGGFGFNQK